MNEATAREAARSRPRLEPARLTEPVDEDRDHIRGAKDAPITLVEYADFQCPHCARARGAVERLLRRMGDRVRFVMRHFPIEHSHPQALAAAQAAEAAAAQGKFWEMHDRLFGHQDRLTPDGLVALAEELDLDVERFRRELEDGVHEARVREDFRTGVRSGVNGTPTFFIDGLRYDGDWNEDELAAAVDSAAGGTSGAAGGGLAGTAGMRSLLDRSESGAPAACRAVRDLLSTDEIFQRVVATADEEFSRSNRLLFLSGLAAGLSMALSFLARAAVTGALPTESSALMGNLLYPIGFVLIVMGRYQLYTENTLTPVTLVLTRIASLPALFRIWTVVLAANVLGAAIAAYVFARTGIFNADTALVAREFAEHALTMAPWDLFWKAVIAGWLVASMVWLTHAARDSTTRLLMVFAIMVLIPAADLFHCIVGACEVLYLVFQGGATFNAFFWDFFTPVTLGNTVGGVLLVAILNFSQTRNERFLDRDCSALELPWRDWCFRMRIGHPAVPDSPRDSES